MEIVLFSFTKKAAQAECLLKEQLQCDDETQTAQLFAYTIERLADDRKLLSLNGSLQKTVQQHFQKGNVLIFVGACGIAVRSIAPFIQSKQTDPCVLVVDEACQYVIPLLSGHIGKGNRYAGRIAKLLGAVPVITTATDVNQTFAVDVFAAENDCVITDMQLAKEIAAHLLEQEPVGMVCGKYITPPRRLPKEVVLSDTYKKKEPIAYGCVISPFLHVHPFAHTLPLIPKQVVLGIGCKKGTRVEKLRAFVTEICRQQQLDMRGIAAVTSIDLKKEEPALVALAEACSCPFVTYDTDTLRQQTGDFTPSAFVRQVTGVDNVCERSAVAYCGADTLICKKIARDGMTLAIALRPLVLQETW